MAGFHKLTIRELRRETEDCITLDFLIPDTLKNTFKFTSGQYVTLKKEINGEELRRDYSICSSPDSNNLKIAIKAVKNGKFSTYANTQLMVNDTIDVAPPKGRFTFVPNANTKRTVVAFAAGSGITPILSIGKSLLENEPESTFILIYGNKSMKDTMFFEELVALEKKYPHRCYSKFLFSRTREEQHLFGRIDKNSVDLMFKNEFKNSTVDLFYICGPSEMITTVKNTLLENNINEEHIKFELFTPATPTKIEQKNTQELYDGASEITVIVDDDEHTFTMSSQKSILETSLKEDLDVPYSCQGGICSSCIARVTKGSATMRENVTLTDSEIAEGLVLTCIAYPTSSTLTVNYDDA